jgi:predicted nucleic acid-binding protein
MIALDSNVFIYVLDKHPRFFEPARAALNAAARESVVISALVYTESLAKLRGRVFEESREWLDALCEQAQIKVVDIDAALAVSAAQLRSSHKLKTADALHIATALSCGASRFITNDLLLTRLAIKGLDIQGL